MVIKIKRDNDFVYLGATDLLDKTQKKRADNIYKVSENEFHRLSQRLKSKNSIDSLEYWYLIGKLANKIIADFKISNSEKKYFWLMLYDFSGDKVPARALKFHIQNDFHIASLLAKYNIKDLRRIGPWAMWREILGSTKIMQDERVGEWVAKYIIDNQVKTRDSARPILKLVRNRLKSLNTTVLSDSELLSKLNEIRF